MSYWSSVAPNWTRTPNRWLQVMPGFGEPSNASLPQLQCLACSALRTGKRVGLWGVFSLRKCWFMRDLQWFTYVWDILGPFRRCVFVRTGFVYITMCLNHRKGLQLWLFVGFISFIQPVHLGHGDLSNIPRLSNCRRVCEQKIIYVLLLFG